MRLQEGANINKSLLALANCINALAENGSKQMRKNVKVHLASNTLILYRQFHFIKVASQLPWVTPDFCRCSPAVHSTVTRS